MLPLFYFLELFVGVENFESFFWIWITAWFLGEPLLIYYLFGDYPLFSATLFWSLSIFLISGDYGVSILAYSWIGIFLFSSWTFFLKFLLESIDAGMPIEDWIGYCWYTPVIIDDCMNFYSFFCSVFEDILISSFW
jgi:hypothetical protein